MLAQRSSLDSAMSLPVFYVLMDSVFCRMGEGDPRPNFCFWFSNICYLFLSWLPFGCHLYIHYENLSFSFPLFFIYLYMIIPCHLLTDIIYLSIVSIFSFSSCLYIPIFSICLATYFFFSFINTFVLFFLLLLGLILVCHLFHLLWHYHIFICSFVLTKNYQ